MNVSFFVVLVAWVSDDLTYGLRKISHTLSLVTVKLISVYANIFIFISFYF